jgi:thioesterase domain-containing protein
MKQFFISAHFVHLLRNPRECLGACQQTMDLNEAEQHWTMFTKHMVESEMDGVLIRHEDLVTNAYQSTMPILSRLSIPHQGLSANQPQSHQPQVLAPYKGTLRSDTCSLSWRLGYRLSKDDSADNLLFINPDARQGAVIWLQRGDPSKPALVLLHGVLGTPVAAQLQSYLPQDTPIMTLQAPELIENFPVNSTFERASAYLRLVASELGTNNPSVHLVGYSLSGALAFEMATRAKDGPLNCLTLCMIDPVPYCPRALNTNSYLMQRAEFYDFAFGTLLLKETNLIKAVSLNDITCMKDLEQHAFSATSEPLAREISRIVDTTLKLDGEVSTLDISSDRKKYAGPCVFFTAQDSAEFFGRAGLNGCHHNDGIYGWRYPLGDSAIEAIPLATTHTRIFTHKESVLQIAETLVSLYNGEITSPQTRTPLHVVSNPIRSQEQWEEMREHDPSQTAAQLIHWYAPENESWQAQNSESCWDGWSTTGTPVLVESPWTPWKALLDQSDAPYQRWYSGAATNAAFNEIDRHVMDGFGPAAAIIEDQTGNES